ncbi:MAG TPA: molybdate ABC transporter substrate-binding protein [Solirubrobacterales bacterium]|nr:molybdate ABC transporter substrate-binding protein [Solirubrobacterales bacterium]
MAARVSRLQVALLLATQLGAVVLGAGCGGDEADSEDELIVSAASSLQEAFTVYADEAFPDADVKQSFAGSDVLAAQIRQGLRPDVYAAADAELPQKLFDEGLVERPRIFAGNELVVAVPADSPISSVADLAEPGLSLVIGDPSVPVGGYTREALRRLPTAEREAILANVGSEEPEVAAVIGKLTQGAADAGFAYVTDVMSAGSELRAVRLPESLEPVVSYGIAGVRDAPHPELAQRFVAGLLEGQGAETLRQAGFLPPP